MTDLVVKAREVVAGHACGVGPVDAAWCRECRMLWPCHARLLADQIIREVEPPPLEVLRRLSEAASPGPWRSDGHARKNHLRHEPDARYHSDLIRHPSSDGRSVAETFAWDWHDKPEVAIANAAFIAAAVNYVREFVLPEPSE